MPFTFSHPAIILPLDRIFKKNVSLTGLIIGSLTPDFEYFLRMKIQSEYAHTILGSLWFDLPLGILLCFLFHNIIKISLIDNLPLFVQKRLGTLRKLDWLHYFSNHWIIVCLSLIIGIFSHIFWDSFTHSGAFFTVYLGLDRKIYGGIPLYKILQHLSTLIGGVVLLFYFFSLKSDNYTTSAPKVNYWIKVLIVTAMILGIRFLYGLKIVEYGNVLVSGIAAFLLSLLFVSMYENRKTTGKIVFL